MTDTVSSTDRTYDRTAPNQASAVPDHDAWAVDSSSRWWLEHMLAECTVDGGLAAYEPVLGRIGRAIGSTDFLATADRANRNEPRLRVWDRYAKRVDEVDFDPGWHECIDAVTGSGVCAMPWLDPSAGYLVRAAAAEMWGRVDIGVMCPITMTSAAMPVLARDPDGPGGELHAAIMDAARAGFEDSVVPGAYTGRDGRHPLVGMAMTEAQGGSDLANSSTVATEQPDGTFHLHGHKWFFSHPMVDAALVLAREPGAGEGSRGLSCFLVPGWLPDGSRNGIEVQRLKEKLGTRSLASSEIVFNGAVGTRIGEPGRGVPTIIEMVVHTRMDCVLGSAGVMARAVGEAVNHARGRAAFGSMLVDQPLMQMVLADLMLEREGSIAMAYEVARGFQAEDPISRLVTAVSKYWVTRRAVSVCIEACEALGGSGYTEEFVIERLYRDAQVNSTWEGSGNVMALDVLRALAKDPSLLQGTFARIGQLVEGSPEDIATDVAQFAASIDIPTGEADARRFTGRLAVALQAALLAHRAGVTGSDDDARIARAFISTRLTPTAERVFGDGDSTLAEAAEALLARVPLPA